MSNKKKDNIISYLKNKYEWLTDFLESKTKVIRGKNIIKELGKPDNKKERK